MSEKIYVHNQHEQDRNDHELEDHSQEILDELAEKARDAKNEHAEKLEDIRVEAKAEAIDSADLRAKQNEQDRPEPAQSLVNRDLKDIKYKRTLQSVRKNLSAPEKALSRVVHNPAVDAVSAAAEKTIARPSGLLAGGFFAFLGSSTFLYIAKHYGYEYNFLLFALFFLGGFALGLLIELVFRVFKKSPKS